MSIFCFLLFISYTISSEIPDKYILQFPRNDNPLNIEVVKPYEKNYIITIGDWGTDPVDKHDKAVQKKIADKMKQFYNKQAKNGYNLLMVLSVGDNFYPTGVKHASSFDTQWKEVYGNNLTSVPWLSVFGNHDWGDNDYNAMCAWTNPKYINPLTKIPYSSNQLIKSKGGLAPINYYIPDFSYYYTINELNLEIITMELTSHFCPKQINDGHINKKTFINCDPQFNYKKGVKIGCNYLKKINKASESLLVERAKHSSNSNFLILQHYPTQMERMIAIFKRNRVRNEEDKVWTLSGHTHEQKCMSIDNNDDCDEIITGGGGGCCWFEQTLRGFYVIGFDNYGKMIQPYSINNTDISCMYPCKHEIKKDEPKPVSKTNWSKYFKDLFSQSWRSG